MLQQSDNEKEDQLDIIYSTKHGLLINNQYFDYSLTNATSLYLIVKPIEIENLDNLFIELTEDQQLSYLKEKGGQSSFFLCVDGLTFADVIYS